jgi:hypothetical protein
MRRFLAFIVLLSAFVPLAAAQQKPSAAAAPSSAKPVAEGQYDVFNSWTLWADPDKKQLRAEIAMRLAADLARTKGKPVVQKETLWMDVDFTMRGFRYESKNMKGLPDGALECMVNPQSLDCVSTFEKRSGKGKINVGGGYATQFGVEMAFLDLPWFFDTLVAQSDRDPKEPRTFGVVSIAFDGDTPETLVTANSGDAKITYAGEQSIKLLGRSVKAHKLNVEARHYSATVWVADSGLLLAADWADMHFELTRYRQWTALIPEFPVEASGTVPANP